MKKILVFLITFFSFISICFAYDFDIKSEKVIMVNLNEDMILYEKNANEKSQIASLTKIVTAITVIENQPDLNKKVVVKSNMLTGLDGYAKAGYRVGDEVTYFELLYALMLPSAADAGQILAIDMAGSIENFSDMMNEEIKKIGVKNSRFSNPVGIDDDNNYSTASDLYKILDYALDNEMFKTLFETDSYYAVALGKTIYKTLSNTAKQNNLDVSVIKGAKTGFTYDAGMCLASISEGNNVKYLIITLDAPVDTLYHISDTVNLYNYYIDNYEYIKIISKDELLVTLPVKKSKTKEISIYTDKEVEKYLEKTFDKNNLKKEYKGEEEITSKIKKGDKIGVVEFKYDNEILYTYDVYLNEDIKYYNYNINRIILAIIIVIVILIIRRIIKVKKKRKRKH